MSFFTKLSVVSLTVVVMLTCGIMECAAASTTMMSCDASIEKSATDTAQSSGVSSRQSSTLNVCIVENEIRVSDVPDGSVLSIYAITGARIASYTVHENRVIMDRTLEKGIYIIRVNNKAVKITIR